MQVKCNTDELPCSRAPLGAEQPHEDVQATLNSPSSVSLAHIQTHYKKYSLSLSQGRENETFTGPRTSHYEESCFAGCDAM